MPMARAILGRMRAVRMEDTRLTLWLSSTILPEMAATPVRDTSTILPVFSSLNTPSYSKSKSKSKSKSQTSRRTGGWRR